MKKPILIISIVITSCILGSLYLEEIFADIIYLKNGMQMEGIITKETKKQVVVDLGFGKTKVNKNKIKKIVRSDEQEKEQLKQSWEIKKEEKQKQAEVEKSKAEAARQLRIAKIKMRKKRLMQRQKMSNKAFVKYIQRQNGIGVEAYLDGKVKAELLVDTGASLILLRPHIANKLGIKTLHGKIVNLQVADGRIVKGVKVYLKSVSVNGMEAKDVAACVLINEHGTDAWDGLLGMSYLSNFIFRIDSNAKQLILERKVEK